MGWRCVRSPMCRLVMPCDRRRERERGKKNQRRRKEKQTLSLTVRPDVPGKWPTPSEPTWHPAHVSVGRPHLARLGPCEQILPIWWRGRTNTQTRAEACVRAKQTDVFSSSSRLDFFFTFHLKIQFKVQKNKKKTHKVIMADHLLCYTRGAGRAQLCAVVIDGSIVAR